MTVARPAAWDPFRAEYADTARGQHKHLPQRPCSVCGKPTRAVSGVCCDHPLEQEPLFDPDARPEPRSSQIGPDDPWPPGF